MKRIKKKDRKNKRKRKKEKRRKLRKKGRKGREKTTGKARDEKESEDNLKRYKKASYHWYKKVIESNGEDL